MSHISALGSSVINLNQPGTYLHWNIFYVSLANLVLIAVMVVIFGAALLLPFPKGHQGAPAGEPGSGTCSPESAQQVVVVADGTEKMWTSRVRRQALRLLPPGKLLPDHQPAYVASWIYVFGVASLAALGMAIVSGFVIALGGVDWWHTNPVGHFFNSLHLWSVELFMALIVIHLWGKFWMAAWRGRRTLTWITGVVAFAASIVECFTGYLSQQNFDSQWLSTSGKDAFNSVGVGAFFNLMNFGQMLLWHVVLIPIILIALVGGHVLLVRVRGVSHPIDADTAAAPAASSPRARRRAVAAAAAAPWRGPNRRYDLLKEGSIASVIVLALTFALAGLLSSPDIPQLTISAWARADASDFVATAAMELNGTSETATYGPPYNNGTGSVQSLVFAPQTWPGVSQPVNAGQDFVIAPLEKAAPTSPALAAALASYRAAPTSQQVTWATAYYNAAQKMTTTFTRAPVVAKAGPVSAMIGSEFILARSGALDADLIAQQPFYGTNLTKPLLFIEDGAYFGNLATQYSLTGSQWGVMNETSSYPGQPWLWLYTLWYQIPKFSASANVDMIAIYLTGLATLLLLFVPFIPGLRDIPRLIPVHRLIWRNSGQPPPPADAATATPAPGGTQTPVA